MINTITLPPFKKMCVTIGNLPSSFVESMSYYEALCWMYNYLDKTVIPAINTEGEAITELQTAFVTLKSYVDNYFENLDVQEEINNKLDAMAEAGTLTDIIAQYLGLAGVLAFNTVADMKAAENLVNGSTAKTLGYHSINDGGMASYKIRTITNEDVVDEMLIIALHDNSLIAELIIPDMIPIECLGAYGDGTHDDSASIIKAVSLKITVLFKDKVYLCNHEVTISAPCKLMGVNNQRESTNRPYIDFSNSADTNCFILSVKGIIFENLNFKGDRTLHIGFSISNCSRYSFKNCGLYYFNKAIYTNRAWNVSLYDTIFEYCNTCVEFNDVNTSFLFSNTIFYSSTNGIVSNQELDYTNIVGGGFDHVDTCINLATSNYANNITITNAGFEDYITGIIAAGDCQATVIGCTFVNTERTTETYRGSGKINVIASRTDNILTPNKNDTIYISPITPNKVSATVPITYHDIKQAYQAGTMKYYDFDYQVENGSLLRIEYGDNTTYDIEVSICSTAYPETCHFTKYSTTITKTQETFNTFSVENDTVNKIYKITFNRSGIIKVKGYLKNTGRVY